MYLRSLLLLLFMAVALNGHAQQKQISADSLSRAILDLRVEVDQINLNLDTSKKKFKKGILVSTIGYTVTIVGGLMLGRENDDLGKVLLVAGGATGVTGTVMMVDAFSFLSGDKKKRRRK